MLASIWLRLSGEPERRLRTLIEALATQHGTVPFEPHLTVCGIPRLTAAMSDAAAAYVRPDRALPFTLRRTGISSSTVTPFKALVIDFENTSELTAFRDNLRRITGGNQPEPPHISLLYPIDGQGHVLDWASDEARLRGIASQCAARIDTGAFVLGRPVIVTTDGDWKKIRSWSIVREL
jgi:hypothetical protein